MYYKYIDVVELMERSERDIEIDIKRALAELERLDTEIEGLDTEIGEIERGLHD